MHFIRESSENSSSENSESNRCPEYVIDCKINIRNIRKCYEINVIDEILVFSKQHDSKSIKCFHYRSKYFEMRNRIYIKRDKRQINVHFSDLIFLDVTVFIFVYWTWLSNIKAFSWIYSIQKINISLNTSW